MSLSVLTAAFSALAVVSGGLAVHLVRAGAYPPAGEGSLGHVGIVVAGAASGFAAIVLVLLAIYTGLRAREVRGASRVR